MRRYQRMIARAKRARLGQGIPDSVQRHLLEQRQAFEAKRWKVKAAAWLTLAGAAALGAAAAVVIGKLAHG